jgi:hypothetical protein
MLGFWLMCLFIYKFVIKYSGWVASGAAMLFPINTLAYDYAYEARPYGLLLGFSALVLYCWRCACGRGRRFWPVVGLAFGLAAAFACHWFAVLLLIPLGLGEMTRLRQTGKPDWPVWLASAIAVLSIGLWYPMIENARSYREHVALLDGALFYGLNFDEVWQAYLRLFQDSAPFLCIIILLLSMRGLGPRQIQSQDGGNGVPTPQLAVLMALMGFLLLPLAGAMPTVLLKGQYSPRYVIPTVVGMGVAIGIATHQLEFRWKPAGIIIFTSAVALGFLQIYHHKMKIQERSLVGAKSGVFSLLHVDIHSLDPKAPIVIPGIHPFYQLRHYSPPELADRLIYVLGYNPMGSTVLQRMRRWVPCNAATYDELIRKFDKFYVFEFRADTEYAPVLPRLIADGARVSDSGYIDARDIFPRPGYLYQVELKDHRGSSSRISAVPGPILARSARSH